jgi:hypothetical protein
MVALTPFEEGKKAFRNNLSLIDNPYPRYTSEYDWWNLGWKDEWWDEGKTTWRPH